MLPNKTFRRNRGFLFLTLMLIAALALSGCGKKEPAADAVATGDTVALYKEGSVTKTEFDSFKGVIKLFDPMYAQFVDDPSVQKNLLDQLIVFKILESKASADAKKEAEPKIKEQLDQADQFFNQQFGSKEERDKQLKEMLNVSFDDIKRYIERSTIVMVNAEKQVTDQQVKDNYDNKLKENKNAFAVATVSHVLVGFETADGQQRTKEEALARAKEVQGKLVQTGDFATIAKEYSDDPGSKDKAGKYENANIQDWVEPFREAAATLPLNQVSDPVETEYGYHVMKVESRSSKTFDQVKDQMRSELAEKRVMDFSTNELPGLIVSVNLPQPTAQPAPDAPAEGSGAAPSPDPNATATPEAKK